MEIGVWLAIGLLILGLGFALGGVWALRSTMDRERSTFTAAIDRLRGELAASEARALAAVSDVRTTSETIAGELRSVAEDALLARRALSKLEAAKPTRPAAPPVEVAPARRHAIPPPAPVPAPPAPAVRDNVLPFRPMAVVVPPPRRDPAPSRPADDDATEVLDRGADSRTTILDGPPHSVTLVCPISQDQGPPSKKG